jgi:ATP-dependent exoDNAse (exonuclease V) beta subunit
LCKLTSALTHPYNPVYLFDLIESNNVNIAFSVEAIVGLTDSEKTEKMVDCLSQYYKMVLGMTWQELIKNVQSRPVLMMLRKIYEATKPWKAESTSIERQMHYRTNYELLFEELTRTNRKSYLTLDAINEALHISISTGTDAKSRELIDAVDYVKVICTTVHRSKGLEYDSVILPFTTDKIDVLRRNALDVTYVDGKVGYMLNLATNPVINEYFITENEVQETKMEEARILYVALTRAINKFVWFEKESGTGTTWGSILEELDICQ